MSAKTGLVLGLSGKMTGKQRRFLRSLAHALSPIVNIGHAGATGPVVTQTDGALTQHELVKVKILQSFPGGVADVAQTIAEGTNSALVQVLGRVLVFYRPHPIDPKIVLPAGRD